MALFGSGRDANLIRSVNRELINKYIDTEVGFYKLNLEATKTNIYDESDDKVYYSVMKINSIILRESRTQQADDFGIDYTRPVTFGFVRDDLKDKNIVIETGDIIEYNGEFHEIEFGYSVSVICESHVTRKNRLNIQEVRSGINKPNNIPRNL